MIFFLDMGMLGQHDTGWAFGHKTWWRSVVFIIHVLTSMVQRLFHHVYSPAQCYHLA